MELKQYIGILRKERKIISGTVLLVFVLVMAFSGFKKTFYENDMLLLISRNGTQNTADYKYDGYYAGQASDNFADNVSQWLTSASMAHDIYSRAKVSNGIDKISNFSKIFKAKKMASQYVEVRYQTKSAEEGRNIARAIVDVLQEKADSLSKASSEEISFKIIYNDPFILESKTNFAVNGILAVLGGLFLGIFMAFIRYYFE